MDKYYIFYSVKSISDNVRILLKNICSDEDVIKCPNIKDGLDNYVYLRSDRSDLIYEIKRIVNIVFLNQMIMRDEIEKFFINIKNDKNEMSVGDYVLVSGYGKMVFEITDVMDSSVSVISKLRNIKFAIEDVPLKKIKAHTDSAYFKYKTFVFVPDKGNILIDYKYMMDNYDFINYRDFMNFLIRIKLQFGGYRIIMCNYLNEQNRVISDVVDAFNIPTVPGFCSGSVLISDKNYFIRIYKTIINIVDNKFVYLSRNSIPDLNKFEILCNIINLKKSGVITENVSMSDIKSFISSSDIQSIKRRFRKYWDAISVEMSMLSNRLYEEPEYKDPDIDSINELLELNHMVWFLENYDYYLKIMMG